MNEIKRRQKAAARTARKVIKARDPEQCLVVYTDSDRERLDVLDAVRDMGPAAAVGGGLMVSGGVVVFGLALLGLGLPGLLIAGYLLGTGAAAIRVAVLARSASERLSPAREYLETRAAEAEHEAQS